jgi:hypothetical protein
MQFEYPPEAGTVLVDVRVGVQWGLLWVAIAIAALTPVITAIRDPHDLPPVLIIEGMFSVWILLLLLLQRWRVRSATVLVGLLAVCENGLVVDVKEKSKEKRVEFVPWRAIASVSRRLVKTSRYTSMPIYDVNCGKTVSMAANRLSRTGRPVEQAIATIVARRGFRWVGSVAMSAEAAELLRTNRVPNRVSRVEQRGKDTYAELSVTPEQLRSSEVFAMLPDGTLLKMKLAAECAGKTLRFAGRGSQEEGDLYLRVVVHTTEPPGKAAAHVQSM